MLVMMPTNDDECMIMMLNARNLWMRNTTLKDYQEIVCILK